MYGKLFTQMYDGTLVADWRALVTFQQMIVLCNKDGVIDITPKALSSRTGIPLEVITLGIKFLELPDAGSRTPGSEGRRIERLDAHRDWGWQIVNYEKYRQMVNAEEKRTADRERIAEKRALARVSQSVADSSAASPVSQNVADVAQVEVEVKAEVKEKLPSVAKRDAKNRATQFPNDFLISNAHHAKAKRLGLDLAAEFEQFRADAISKGKSFVVWELAFSAWLGRAHQFNHGKTAPPIDYDRLTREIEERDET